MQCAPSVGGRVCLPRQDHPSVVPSREPQHQGAHHDRQGLSCHTGSLPLRRGLFGYPWAYYWTTAAQGGDLIILVANSSPIALVYDRVGNALGEAALGELGCWAIADRVLCPSRAYSPTDLRGRALMLKPDDILAVMFDEWGNPVLAGQFQAEVVASAASTEV